MDSGAWILCPHHKQGRLPCRWLVEVELPPGQVRTALRTTVSLHTLTVPSRPSSGASELVAQSLLLKIYSQSYSSRVRAFWAGGEHRCPPHTYTVHAQTYTQQTHMHTHTNIHMHTKSHINTHTHQFSLAQSHPTFCNPMGCCLPGSFVHGILQARILEWVAMPSSRGSSHTNTHTHTYTYTHTQELLESEEVSSKRLEGRKERKDGRGKPF